MGNTNSYTLSDDTKTTGNENGGSAPSSNNVFSIDAENGSAPKANGHPDHNYANGDVEQTEISGHVADGGTKVNGDLGKETSSQNGSSETSEEKTRVKAQPVVGVFELVRN